MLAWHHQTPGHHLKLGVASLKAPLKQVVIAQSPDKQKNGTVEP